MRYVNPVIPVIPVTLTCMLFADPLSRPSSATLFCDPLSRNYVQYIATLCMYIIRQGDSWRVVSSLNRRYIVGYMGTIGRNGRDGRNGRNGCSGI